MAADGEEEAGEAVRSALVSAVSVVAADGPLPPLCRERERERFIRNNLHRDLMTQKKRPTNTAKETYGHRKRDLLQLHKRPTNAARGNY